MLLLILLLLLRMMLPLERALRVAVAIMRVGGALWHSICVRPAGERCGLKSACLPVLDVVGQLVASKGPRFSVAWCQISAAS